MINNLELYKIFFCAAKTKSVTKAAKELAITQPAVSQAIRQLEEQLNVKLFIRSSKGIILSHEGEIMYPYIERCFEEINNAEKKIKETLDIESGEIRIGASDMTLKYYLLPQLEAFHKKYPKIKVIISNSPTPETLDALWDGRIDFGIVSTPLPPEAGKLKSKRLREVKDIFVASPTYISNPNRIYYYAELTKLPLICLEKRTSTRTYLDAFLKEKHLSINPEFELATSDMIIQFAMKNFGIGYVMEDFAKEYLESGQLVKLRTEDELPPRFFELISKEQDMLTPAAAKFIEMLD